MNRREILTGAVAVATSAVLPPVPLDAPLYGVSPAVIALRRIDDEFLASMFRILHEHPDMTATQIIEVFYADAAGAPDA